MTHATKSGSYKVMRNILDVPEEPVTHLPIGYPAYCIYVESGLNQNYEVSLWSTLKTWGKSLGKNLYVARWSIGDSSYIQLVRTVGIVPTPAIVLTDSNTFSTSSFFIRLDSSALLKDLPTMQGVLPMLLNRVLVGDRSDAVKAATKAKRSRQIRKILGEIGDVLAKVKVSFSYGGATVTIGS